MVGGAGAGAARLADWEIALIVLATIILLLLLILAAVLCRIYNCCGGRGGPDKSARQEQKSNGYGSRRSRGSLASTALSSAGAVPGLASYSLPTTTQPGPGLMSLGQPEPLLPWDPYSDQEDRPAVWREEGDTHSWPGSLSSLCTDSSGRSTSLSGLAAGAGPRFAWLAQLYTEETSESSDSDTEQEDTDPHRVVIGIESWV